MRGLWGVVGGCGGVVGGLWGGCGGVVGGLWGGCGGVVGTVRDSIPSIASIIPIKNKLIKKRYLIPQLTACWPHTLKLACLAFGPTLR